MLIISVGAGFTPARETKQWRSVIHFITRNYDFRAGVKPAPTRIYDFRAGVPPVPYLYYCFRAGMKPAPTGLINILRAKMCFGRLLAKFLRSLA